MSTPESSLEVERKFAVGAGFALPDLSTVPGVAAVTGPQTYHLTAIYLDTPGLDLAAAHITLRRRCGGSDDGWHLARLAAVPGIDTWRQWVWEWDATPGNHVIEARATDATGYTQTAALAPPPPNGATGYPTVNVTVQ